jgi:uncharacterized membrane protein
MFGSEFHGWWIFPLLMIILCIFMCAFMMKGRMGAMICRSGSRSKSSRKGDASASALAVLNRRHAQGETNKEKHEDKRSVTTRHN